MLIEIDLNTNKVKISHKEPEDKEKWTSLLDENQNNIKGYEISNLGRVRKYGELRKTFISDGYISVGINGKSKRVHRLVLQSFKPTKNKNLVVDHIDNNGLNPKLENLQWLTNAENVAKGYRQNGPNENYQKVRGINIETGEIKRFKSLREAGRYVNRNGKTIADAIRYDYKVAGSWVFDKEEK